MFCFGYINSTLLLLLLFLPTTDDEADDVELFPPNAETKQQKQQGAATAATEADNTTWQVLGRLHHQTASRLTSAALQTSAEGLLTQPILKSTIRIVVGQMKIINESERETRPGRGRGVARGGDNETECRQQQRRVNELRQGQ